jgi:transposase-like protein
MVDGVFPGKESCVVVALAIDADGNKHLLDFEEGSSESTEVVKPRIRSWVSIFHRKGAEVAKERRALHVGR